MASNRRDFPERLTVEVTNRCNISCTFCPRQHLDMRLGDMDRALFTKIIDEAAEHMPVSLILFFRGEPLLHPEFLDFLRYARQKGISDISIATNAVFLDEKTQDALIDAQLYFLSVSLDTDDAQLYHASRVYGDFERSKANLLAFCAKCKAARAEGRIAPQIQVSTVDIDAYRGGQEDFVALWRQHADIVRVYEEHSADGNMGSAARLRGGVAQRRPCKKVYTDMVIYWDGTAALCNHDWDNRLNIGNVFEQSIYDIWNSEAYERIRAMHEDGAFSEDIVCKRCDHWMAYYLPGGVLGKVYA